MLLDCSPSGDASPSYLVRIIKSIKLLCGSQEESAPSRELLQFTQECRVMHSELFQARLQGGIRKAIQNPEVNSQK